MQGIKNHIRGHILPLKVVAKQQNPVLPQLPGHAAPIAQTAPGKWRHGGTSSREAAEPLDLVPLPCHSIPTAQEPLLGSHTTCQALHSTPKFMGRAKVPQDVTLAVDGCTNKLLIQTLKVATGLFWELLLTPAKRVAPEGCLDDTPCSSSLLSR